MVLFWEFFFGFFENSLGVGCWRGFVVIDCEGVGCFLLEVLI